MKNQIKKYVAVFVSTFLLVISLKINFVQAQQSQDIIYANLIVSQLSYTVGEQADVCFSLQNYNETISGNITTMIVKLSYDTEKLTPKVDSFKKIAEENDGMGFSHIGTESGNTVVYQYVNVGEPLKKGSTELFSLAFDVLENVNSVEDSIQTVEVILQDGTQQESVRYTVETSVLADKKAEEIVKDASVGLQVYEKDGSLMSEEQQKEIRQEAEVKKAESQKIDNATQQNSSNEFTKDGVTDSIGKQHAENGLEKTAEENNSVQDTNNKTKNVFVVVVLIITVAIAITGSIIALKWQNRKKG